MRDTRPGGGGKGDVVREGVVRGSLIAVERIRRRMNQVVCASGGGGGGEGKGGKRGGGAGLGGDR